MQNAPSTTPEPGTAKGQLTALRWLTATISVLVIVMAGLAGQGVWGGDRDLIAGHGYLGNGIFALAAISAGIGFLAWQKGQIGRANLILLGLVVVLLFAQIGLGYSGSRNESSLIAWHLPNGVLLMGASTLNAALLWLRPRA